MALTTRCPQCHAVFRVVADQLKLRGGLVRCGQCATVFDAISALSYLEDAQLKQALAARAPAPPASRPAAPAPTPAPLATATPPAESSAAAATLPASMAPLMLTAAPVVARAEPVEWAQLRRAAADSPLLLGGEHAAPSGAGGATSAPGAAAPENARDNAKLDAETADDATPASASAAGAASAEQDLITGDAAREGAPSEGTATPAPDAPDAPEAREAPDVREADEEAPFATARLEVQDPAADREDTAGGDSVLAASEATELRDGLAATPNFAASPRVDDARSYAESEADGGALPDRDIAMHASEAASQPAATDGHGSDSTIAAGAADDGASDPTARDVAVEAHALDTALTEAASDPGARDTTGGAAAEVAPAPVEAGFLNSVAQARARRRTWLWGLGATLAAAALAWQLAVALRAEILMRWPQAQPLLVRLCEPLGCQVEWPMQPALLAVLASDLQAVPGTSALELDVTLRNRAPYPQALPAIELTLMDTRGQAIARRVFTPAEYGAPAQGSLAPGADLAARVLFEVQGPAPAGFLVYPFYP